MRVWGQVSRTNTYPAKHLGDGDEVVTLEHAVQRLQFIAYVHENSELSV